LSGVTTVVSGVLKQALKPDVHGVSIAGGKGRKSTSAKTDIPLLAEGFGLSSARIGSLLHASRTAAKVDSAAVQDGYSLTTTSYFLTSGAAGRWFSRA
jgi:hypothetical protein